MLENIVSIVTTIVGLLVALWRFMQSPLGLALTQAIKSGSVMQARALLEKQALCIATKYQQTLVKGLKEDLADGTLTEAEVKKRLEEIKKDALADFKASAAGSSIGTALAVIGIKDSDKLMDQLLEGAVHTLRLMTPEATPSEPIILTADVKEEK